MNCTQANELQITDYLLKIGISPEKKTGNKYWYLSPFRDEKTASFIVDTEVNKWKDFGANKNGKLIDLVIELNKTDAKGALEIISKSGSSIMPMIHEVSELQARKESENPIIITGNKPLKYFDQDSRPQTMLSYLQDRGIKEEIASIYCKAVFYTYSDRRKNRKPDLFAVGFQNDSGGWELRNIIVKKASSPKDITTITGKGTEKLFIFEGFIDFLSCLQKMERVKFESTVIILNGLSQINTALEKAKQYSKVALYLDNDQPGIEAAQKIIDSHPHATNESKILFPDYNDYNDYLLNKKK